MVLDSEGKTCLHWSAGSGNLEATKAIVNAWRNPSMRHPDEAKLSTNLINMMDYEGRTPLHLAVAIGNEKMAAFLLQEPTCDHKAQDALGRTPLLWASQLGFPEIVKLLLPHGDEQLFL